MGTPDPKPSCSMLAAFGAGAGLLALSLNSIYVVQLGEMAGVRRLGRVVSTEPVGPGPLLKFPWVDTVDTIQTKLNLVQVAHVGARTADGTNLDVNLGILQRILAAAVLPLFYDVERIPKTGGTGLVAPILSDRATQVVSSWNWGDLQTNRVKVEGEIRDEVASAVTTILGLEVIDVQVRWTKT